MYEQAAAGAFRDVQELRQSLQEVKHLHPSLSWSLDELFIRERHTLGVSSILIWGLPSMQVLSADDKETESDTEPAMTTQQNCSKEPLSDDCRALLDRLEGKENPLAAGLKVCVLVVECLALCKVRFGCGSDPRALQLQAVDDHVGLLAEGVAGLAGTLWGGARTASTHVAGQVSLCHHYLHVPTQQFPMYMHVVRMRKSWQCYSGNLLLPPFAGRVWLEGMHDSSTCLMHSPKMTSSQPFCCFPCENEHCCAALADDIQYYMIRLCSILESLLFSC